jgi:hypothetical protein
MPDTLNPPVFHILLALSERALHGLGIADQVEAATEGSVELGPEPSTVAQADDGGGLIREVEAPRRRRPATGRYYALTERGPRVAAEEAERWSASSESRALATCCRGAREPRAVIARCCGCCRARSARATRKRWSRCSCVAWRVRARRAGALRWERVACARV